MAPLADPLGEGDPDAVPDVVGVAVDGEVGDVLVGDVAGSSALPLQPARPSATAAARRRGRFQR